MKIALLSRRPDLYSTRRLLEVARARGHEAFVVDTLRCAMDISAEHVHYQGKPLENIDAIIPRIGTSITAYGAAVVRQFERMGVYSLNSSKAILCARDKLHTLQRLAENGIALPKSAFASSQEETTDLITWVGDPPLVVKLLEGTQGMGVVLAETQQAAISVIEAFHGLRAHILVQEFIKEASGADIRCLVVGGRVVASMKRQAKNGEFRSNLHRGGTAAPVQITPQERTIAIKATRAIGLSVAGVDLLRSHRGSLVMEVNASPGLEGIEMTTGKDVASAILRYLEKRVLGGT